MSVTIAQDTVKIPLNTSRKIIQDLGRYDEARVKIVLLEQNVENYKTLVSSLEKSLEQSKEINNNSKLITDLCRADNLTLTKQLRGQTRARRFWQVIAGGLAAGIGYLILKP